MSWFPKTRWQKASEKLNPAQDDIVYAEGDQTTSTATTYTNDAAFKSIAEVQRGISLIVDSSAEINFDVKEKIQGLGVTDTQVRPHKVNKLLNFEANPYQDINQFRSQVYTDLVSQGDAFIYWDGAYLYNIPAEDMIIVSDTRTFIDRYEYGTTKFSPNEIIHIREPNPASLYRGASRLDSVSDNITLLDQMTSFQSNFLNNGTVSNIVLQTDNILGPKTKERIRRDWARRYSTNKGGKIPIILDGNFEIKSIGSQTLSELDFETYITTNQDTILKALGVPKVLVTSGNNANIAPNLQLFYITTVLPLVNRVNIALERYFGYDLKPNTADVLALRPELAQLSGYYATLVNAGILARNEARISLRYPPVDTDVGNDLFLPQNIAGSALDPSVGGRPTGSDDAVETEE